MADRKSSAIWVTANERFKSRSEDWMTIGVGAAVIAHFALFALFPKLTAENVDFTAEEIEMVELPPEVRIPPPPEQISRPATPRVSNVALDEDITIARTDFESNPIENLPPPPAGARPSDVPSYIPRDVEPALSASERRRLAALAKRRYPSMLREAGISGTPIVFAFIDEQGDVFKAQIAESSGYAQLDNVAIEVVKTAEFSPAMNRDKPVGVWIRLPIAFTVN